MESETEVFDAIQGLLTDLGSDSYLVPASETEVDDGNSYFIILSGEMIALASFIDETDNDKPFLDLIFNVGCLPNTAIEFNRLVSESVDIPVTSADVFYLDDERVDGTVKVLYNSAAFLRYTESISEALLERKEKKEKMNMELSSNDSKIIH